MTIYHNLCAFSAILGICIVTSLLYVHDLGIRYFWFLVLFIISSNLQLHSTKAKQKLKCNLQVHRDVTFYVYILSGKQGNLQI